LSVPRLVSERVAPQLALPFAPVGTVAGAAPTAELRARAERDTERWLARAAVQWPRAAGPIRVSFALRGRCGGDACGRTSTVRYNADLLAQNGDAFLAEVVPHEVAHIVVARTCPTRRRPHGAEWKTVMRFFGAPARTCHRFETMPARVEGRVTYRCLCPEPHLLTARAHRRIRRRTAEYHCRKCGFALVWLGEKPRGRAAAKSGD
jgi:SprT protein